jgi:streptogramin lyase
MNKMKTVDFLNRNVFTLLLLFILSFGFTTCSEDDKPQDIKSTVTNFAPLEGGRNTILTLKGSHFGTEVNRIRVTLNGKDAIVKSVTDDIITAEVQKGSSSGVIRVIIGERPNAQVLIYDTEFTYVSNQVVSTYLGTVNGETDGSFETASLSKPRFLVWGKDGALYIVEDGASSVTDMACIRVAANNNVSTLLKAADSPLIQRIRALDFSADQNTLYIANDKNAAGTIDFGAMTKIGNSYTNLTELLTEEGIAKTHVKVHPVTGAVFVAYHQNSWIYQYDGGNFVQKAQLLKVDNTTFNANINSIVFDKAGTTVYFVSRGQHVIYKGTYDLLTGNFSDVEIFAGTAGTSGYADGTGVSAKFNTPCQADIDEDGNLYVADRGNNCIRIISPDGEVSTYAGQSSAGMVDGIASQAKFSNPEGCAFGPDGALYVADYSNHLIRKIEETGGQ